MKDKKGISSIVLVFFALILLLGAIAFWLYAQNYGKTNKNSKSANKTVTETEEETEEEEDFDLEDEFDEDAFNELVSSYEDNSYLEESNGYANLWNGVYISGENKIKIYRDGNNTVSLDATSENGMQGLGGIKVDSKEKIEYTDDDFDETINIAIEKNANNEILIKASSTENNSVFNSIDGTYTKKEEEDKGWSGKYADDTTAIILVEIDGNVNIIINNYWQRYTEEFDNEKLVLDSTFIDDEEKLVLKKTTDGIEITEASSTDSSSVLNEIAEKKLKKVD